jgi:hypothetical protein
MSGLEIPYEVVDGIVLAALKDQREYLRTELKQWEDNPRTDLNPTGYWLHPEDVVKNNILIRSMDDIIKYYGGE